MDERGPWLVTAYTEEWYNMMSPAAIKRSLRKCPVCFSDLSLSISKDQLLSVWCPENACIYDEGYSRKEIIERNKAESGYLNLNGCYSSSLPASKVVDTITTINDSGDDSGVSFGKIMGLFLLASIIIYILSAIITIYLF